MAHFARIAEASIIEEIIFVHGDDCDGGYAESTERIGQSFIASIGLEGYWKQVDAGASVGDALDAEAGLLGKMVV